MSGRKPNIDKYGFIDSKNVLYEKYFSPIKLKWRELKWYPMFNNSEKSSKKIFRCRKGIPNSLRSLAWLNLLGVDALRAQHPPDYFKELSNKESEYSDVISRDITRELTNHIYFQKNEFGPQVMYSILNAFANHNTEIGYCQAQGPLAAMLITKLCPEDAFWALVSLCENILEGYYLPHFENELKDIKILFLLVKQYFPGIHSKLRNSNLSFCPEILFIEWFACALVRTLPWPTMLRIMDMLICEGKVVLFRACLAIVKIAASQNGGEIESEENFFQTFKRISPDLLNEERFMKEYFATKVTASQIEKLASKIAVY